MFFGGMVKRSKFAGLIFIIFLVMLGQLLVACGSEMAPFPTQAATTTAAPTLAPTTRPTLTPTTAPLNVADRPFYKPLDTSQLDQARKEWFQLIDQNEQKWKAQNVTAYQIEVSFHNTPWPPGELYDLTIRDNKVVNSAFSLVKCMSCGEDVPPTSDPAKRTYKDDRVLTVPGLFELARSGVYSYVNISAAFKISFNPYYGFPTSITTEQLQYTDMGKYWKVESFKELS